MKRMMRALGLLALVIALGGCQQELYTGLTENEANQMIAVLVGAHIPASKSSVTDASDRQAWQVNVDGGDIAAALDVLRANGLPRERFTSLGQMFQKQGLVTTPSEERIRYIYGISQELSRTLLDIDGVVAARVHVVIPENDPLSDKLRPSSAAVFIKYRPGVDLRVMAPMVKDLVAHSIQGLTYDNVSLFLTAAQAPPPSVLRDSTAGGWRGILDVRHWLVVLAAVLVVLTLALLLFQSRERWMSLFMRRGASRALGAEGGGERPPE